MWAEFAKLSDVGNLHTPVLGDGAPSAYDSNVSFICRTFVDISFSESLLVKLGNQ